MAPPTLPTPPKFGKPTFTSPFKCAKHEQERTDHTSFECQECIAERAQSKPAAQAPQSSWWVPEWVRECVLPCLGACE